MQWTLSSENLDIAIICKEAAKEFVKYDKNFEIISPVVKNSDVFLIKNENPKSIGVTQNRKYQETLVKEYYDDIKMIPLISNALTYALENNTVDAVIIDVIRALNLKGNIVSSSTKKDYETYVLVVNKKFKNSEKYNIFLNIYNESIEKLKDDNLLKKELSRYMKKELNDESIKELKRWGLEFCPIIEK